MSHLLRLVLLLAPMLLLVAPVCQATPWGEFLDEPSEILPSRRQARAPPSSISISAPTRSAWRSPSATSSGRPPSPTYPLLRGAARKCGSRHHDPERFRFPGGSHERNLRDAVRHQPGLDVQPGLRHGQWRGGGGRSRPLCRHLAGARVLQHSHHLPDGRRDPRLPRAGPGAHARKPSRSSPSPWSASERRWADVSGEEARPLSTGTALHKGARAPSDRLGALRASVRAGHPRPGWRATRIR